MYIRRFVCRQLRTQANGDQLTIILHQGPISVQRAAQDVQPCIEGLSRCNLDDGRIVGLVWPRTKLSIGVGKLEADVRPILADLIDISTGLFPWKLVPAHLEVKHRLPFCASWQQLEHGVALQQPQDSSTLLLVERDADLSFLLLLPVSSALLSPDDKHASVPVVRCDISVVHRTFSFGSP